MAFQMFGLGFSLLLIAAGAILVFAVNATVGGLDLDVVGWIMMVVGGVGAALSLARGERLWGDSTTNDRTAIRNP